MPASMHQPTGHADVLIIGAGASGGVAALRLLEAGLAVTTLEQGDWHDRADYRGSEWDWELTTAKQWSQMPEVRGARADYPLDVAAPICRSIISTAWVAGRFCSMRSGPDCLHRTFRSFSRFGIADDWPLTYTNCNPIMR